MGSPRALRPPRPPRARRPRPAVVACSRARALHACGSTIAAARDALTDGVAAALGGGMHHASHRLGRGYCTFNDVAIAIAALRADGLAHRVLILDLDVHQGDGNAEFYAAIPTPSSSPSTAPATTRLRGRRPISTSTCPTAPATRPLPGGARRGPRVAHAHGPYDLVMLIAGADPYAGDALGRLSLDVRGPRGTRSPCAASLRGPGSLSA